MANAAIQDLDLHILRADFSPLEIEGHQWGLGVMGCVAYGF
jgi:hypothetical protein